MGKEKKERVRFFGAGRSEPGYRRVCAHNDPVAWGLNSSHVRRGRAGSGRDGDGPGRAVLWVRAGAVGGSSVAPVTPAHCDGVTAALRGGQRTPSLPPRAALSSAALYRHCATAVGTPAKKKPHRVQHTLRNDST